MECRLVVWLRVVWQLQWLVQSMVEGLRLFIFIFHIFLVLPMLSFSRPLDGTEQFRLFPPLPLVNL